MVCEWQEHSFSDLIANRALEIGDGYRAKNSELGGNGLIFLRAGHVRNAHIDLQDAERFHSHLADAVSSKMSKPGDVIVTTKGNSIGRTSYIRRDFPPVVYSPHLSYWRSLNPNVLDPGYLRFWSQSRDFRAQLSGMSASTDMAPYLSLIDQKRLRIVLPPPDEQRTIAGILGALDDKIELNRRMNETLEAMARAIFKDWFVDFGPTRAKLAGRDPHLPPAFWSVFPAKLTDSELGEMPDGWEIAKLGDHFNAVKGVSYKGSGLTESGLALHNLNSIFEGGGYKYEGIKYYNGEYADRHVVRPGDLIVANTEQGHERLLIGYSAIVPNAFGGKGIASHHIYCLRPTRSSPLTALWLCYLLNSPRMHDLVSGYANGTTVNMLPIDGVQKPKIVVPPLFLVRQFNEVASQVQLRCETIIGESCTLAALRDLLLPKLISGEIRVPDAERIAGMAA